MCLRVCTYANFSIFCLSNLVLNLLLGFFNNRPIAYKVEMENKTDKNGKNISFVEILAVLRCDFTILFRALSFSLDFIRFVHSWLPGPKAGWPSWLGWPVAQNSLFYW